MKDTLNRFSFFLIFLIAFLFLGCDSHGNFIKKTLMGMVTIHDAPQIKANNNYVTSNPNKEFSFIDSTKNEELQIISYSDSKLFQEYISSGFHKICRNENNIIPNNYYQIPLSFNFKNGVITKSYLRYIEGFSTKDFSNPNKLEFNITKINAKGYISVTFSKFYQIFNLDDFVKWAGNKSKTTEIEMKKA